MLYILANTAWKVLELYQSQKECNVSVVELLKTTLRNRQMVLKTCVAISNVAPYLRVTVKLHQRSRSYVYDNYNATDAPKIEAANDSICPLR